MIKADLRRAYLDDVDLTDYIASTNLPTKTFRLSGFWEPEVITLTGRVRILSSTSYAIHLDAASYQRLTGRRHPRVGRMHGAYRARRGRQW